MSAKITRREALITAMGTAVVTALPGAGIFAREADKNIEDILPPQKHVSLTKHGQYSDSNLFLWSVLSVSNDQSFLAKIEQILSSAGYKSEIKYNSNDRYKLIPGKKLIDLVFSSSDVSFTMVLFEGIPGQFKGMSPTERNLLNDKMYTNALGTGLSGNLVTKSEDRYGPSDNYNTKFSTKHGVTNKTVNAINDRILQVNDLIGGICCSIIGQRPTKSKIKNELNQYLDNKIGLSALRNNNVINVNKIKINRVKL